MATLSDLALRILISAKDETAPGVKSATQGIRSVSDQLQQVETLAKRFLDVRLFLGWAQDSIKLSDAYAGINGRLRQVVGETGNLAAAQQRLFSIAQATQTPLAENVGLFARSNEALKKFNDSQELAAKLAETVGLSFKAQSSGAAEVSSTITQLTQSIATDAVQWEDFGQLADTNLMLVNVAAKNLGYDGLGSLKKAMSESKVSNIELVNAIIAGYDEIKAAADKMPVTVGGAWTMVANAALKYVGESDKARVSTGLLSGLLQGLANNLGAVADVATVLATLMAGRMVNGWLQSAAAARQAAIAAREKALADREAAAAAAAALPLEIRRAEVEVNHSLNLIREAQLQRALANTEQQRAQAVRLLDAAYAAHAKNVELLNAKTAALSAINGGAAQKAGLLTTGIRLLGSAFNGLFAAWAGWDIGQMIGNWLNQFEAVRKAGTYLAETFVLIKTGADAMLNGASFSDRWQQVKQIHAEFEQIRANDTTAAQASADSVSQSEQQKAQAAEQAAQRQAAAFKQVQDATKALTAQIDADAKAQSAAIQQALAEKLLTIDAGNQLESTKDSQRMQAQLLATQQEIALQQAASSAKLQLIDAEYQKELQSAQNNAQRTAEIENDKRQAKLSVYQGLAEFYTQEVAKLTQVYGQEVQAFALARQNIEQLATTHQQRMLELDRLGMTDRQKRQSEELEFNKTIQALKAELAKGETANQTTVNGLLERAKTLQNDITQAAVSGGDAQTSKSTAIYEAKKRELQLYDLEKTVIANNARAHAENARQVKTALESNQQKLAETKTTIDGITELLAKEYALKIGIDRASLSAAQSIIADLTAPATKTITIQTVNAGNVDTAPAQATGGPAGMPTGQPWRFADGGWARLFGKLSGYGGGDKIRALLEPGEFIVRKEAVQKLGVPALHAINQGQLPAAPIKRASGGLVDAMMQDWTSSKNQAVWENIRAFLTEKLRYLFLFETSTTLNDPWTNHQARGTLTTQATDMADAAGLGNPREMRQQIGKIIETALNSGSAEGVGSVVQSGIKFLSDSANKPLINTQSANTPGGLSTGFKMPTINMPTLPSLPAAAPSMAAPAKTVTVQFKSPDGGQVSASFGSESDVNKMLGMIKESGMRVGVS